MTKFKIGDGVKLKIGRNNPCMFIAEVIEKENNQIWYKCKWIDNEKKIQTEDWLEESLVECPKRKHQPPIRKEIPYSGIGKDGFPIE
ncbi:MAG TPA: hypothetical protein PLS10_11875 [Chitinophagales bacterium]|jgi:uncharacterized protein YodC (DUF2158 family)|nr:hypothetical protein [Chitinophagales bacterium]